MGSNGFEIIESCDARFHQALHLLAPIDDAKHPRHSKFGLSYYPIVLGEKYKDQSFALYGSDGPLAVALCGTDGVSFSQFGAPIEFFLFDNLPEKLKRRVQSQMINYLISVAKNEEYLKLADKIKSTLSQLGEIALAGEGRPALQVMAAVDLTLEIDEIYSSLRKRYRPFINWGRRNITLDYVNASSLSLEKFREFQEFHRIIAGRSTRSQDSWDVMFSALEEGMGELSLGYLDGELVSGTLIIDGKDISIYASGVYERSKFDHPISHWPMYDAILRSKRRAKKIFEIGPVDSLSNTSKKEMQIANFKRGFASRLSPELFWLVPVQR